MESLSLLHMRFSRRRDLKFTRQASSSPNRGATDAVWNVLDPISRQSFRIGWIEHWLLTRVDRKRTVEQWLDQLCTQNPQLRELREKLLALVQGVYEKGLLLATQRPAIAPAATSPLQSFISSVVVWQIRGIQPDRWLRRAAPHFDFLFSATAVKFWMCVVGVAVCGVSLEFQRLSSQATSWNWFTNPASGGMLLGVFLITRAIHELAHAILCRRYGVRCPDIGLFVILGAPCVYCDVSESWQLPRRRDRAAVAAAGMYVELILAALAACAWLATIDGPVNTLALQTMFVCSISTLLINANPLMRFDGYYILADWLNEVNLRAKADRVLAARLQRWIVGNSEVRHTTRQASQLSSQASRQHLRNRFLLLFSLAGWCYRATLSVAIAATVIPIYSGWNLPWLGRGLAVLILFSWWGVPVMRGGQSLYVEAKLHRRRWRLALFAAACILVIAVFPIPARRFAVGWLQPAESRGIFAGTTGTILGCHAVDGQFVESGDSLFQLESSSVALHVAQREAAAQVAIARHAAMQRARDMYGRDIDLTPYASEMAVSASLAQRALHAQRSLTLAAPISGRLIAQPAPRPSGPFHSDSTDEHATWCMAEHVGRTVEEGTLLATIVSQGTLVVIPLSERQLADVAAGTPVRLRFSSSEGQVTESRVAEIVQLDELSPVTAGGAVGNWPSSNSAFPADSDPHGYAAIVELDESPQIRSSRLGTAVDAVFLTGSHTLWGLASQWLKSNLRWLT